MKKSVLVLLMFVWVSQGYAGFFSSLMGSVVANDLSRSASANSNRPVYLPPSRAKKINAYLWDMHEAKKYNEIYEYYVKELEQSTNISYQDTIAWVYYDNNNSQKAIEVYEKKVMPWLRFEKKKKRKSFERTYRKFTGLKGKIDYAAIFKKYQTVEEDNSTKEVKPDFALLQVQLAELETKNKVLESYKTFLQEHMVLKEKKSTESNVSDIAKLQKKLAELETKNSTLESYKMLTMVMGFITLLVLGLLFVLLRGRKRES